MGQEGGPARPDVARSGEESFLQRNQKWALEGSMCSDAPGVCGQGGSGPCCWAPYPQPSLSPRPPSWAPVLSLIPEHPSSPSLLGAHLPPHPRRPLLPAPQAPCHQLPSHSLLNPMGAGLPPLSPPKSTPMYPGTPPPPGPASCRRSQVSVRLGGRPGSPQGWFRSVVGGVRDPPLTIKHSQGDLRDLRWRRIGIRIPQAPGGSLPHLGLPDEKQWR